MSISARKLNLMRQRLFLPVSQFAGIAAASTSTAPTVSIAGGEGGTVAIGIDSDADAAALSKTAATSRTGITGVQAPTITTAIRSEGAGNPGLTEIGTTGIVALQIDAVGDDIAHTMLVPSNWDRSQPIYVRVVWASESSTAADGVTWKVLYLELTPETTAIATPATALDTVIVEDLVAATAKVIQRSAAGIINGGQIADAALYWSFLVEGDAQTGNPMTDGVYLLGVEFEYTPKLSPGDSPSDEGRGWSV